MAALTSATGATSGMTAQDAQLLDRAQAAAQAFSDYDRERVDRVVRAVASAAEANSDRLGYAAALETGFGVAADKVTKNLAIARGFLEEYGARDYCGHRLDRETKTLMVPKPAGVVLAVIPSTGPVAALYHKVLCAMLTRNAIVLSPHPAAARTGVDAGRILAEAAEAAGAPRHVIQVVESPTIPRVEAMMGDERTKLVLATGGGAVVKAAYRSGTPAIGVGPGNPPAVVDEGADLGHAAKSLVDSKAFDNSILCTAESVVFVMRPADAALRAAVELNGGYFCDEEETKRVRDYVYPSGRFDPAVVGRSAVDLARGAHVAVPPTTRVLVAPFERVTYDEPLTREKLCPVLGWRSVSTFEQAVEEAKALVRIVGIGHSAVIHSNDPQRVLDFSVAMPVHRITVNAPGSLGNAGIGTGLPLTMSVGPGFIGGSSTADNLNPEHFVQWSRTTYAADAANALPDFAAMQPRATDQRARGDRGLDVPEEVLRSLIREDLRRLVVEELRDLMGAR